MALICTVCGAENMEGSIYCEDCGARLPVSSGSAAPSPAPISAPPVASAPAPAPAPAPTPQPEPAAEPTREALPAVPEAGGDNVCGTCGAVNPPGEAYCEDCGAALDGAGSSSAIPPAAISETPPPITATPPVSAPRTPMEAVAAAAAGKPRLLATETGQTFVLSKDENLVGRRSPVDGIFPEVDLTEADKDSYISRRHGRIVLSEQGPLYEDLGSSNGSFHNGTRLQQGVQARLSEGDNLRLGRTELTFHSH